eukprot:1806183-Prorocentrum_lima.AAC.1
MGVWSSNTRLMKAGDWLYLFEFGVHMSGKAVFRGIVEGVFVEAVEMASQSVEEYEEQHGMN